MKTLTSLHTGRKGESSIPDLSWGNKFWTKRSKQYVRQIPENFVLSARDKKVFIDLVTLSETVRKNSYLFTLQDRFTRFTSAYLICNKEAGTVARVLIRELFSVFGLQSDTQELKILHTKIPPYNPSSNIEERWHNGYFKNHGKRMNGIWV